MAAPRVGSNPVGSPDILVNALIEFEAPQVTQEASDRSALLGATLLIGANLAHEYAKLSAFEIPESVVIVTNTEEGEPVTTGAVTVQLVWSEQLVGATCPPKRATICPSALRKLTPEITTV